DEHVRFGLRVLDVSWSTADGMWTVAARDESSRRNTRFTAKFVIACTGYYNYDAGFGPRFPGAADFSGQIIHPQQWPEGLDYRGKRVIVIGSGATAVTLVPALATEAAHVTMLQRSPSYLLSMPARDTISERLRRVLPD